MTAPIQQPATAPSAPAATDPAAAPVTEPVVAPPVERVPFAELIEAQRTGTLTGRIAPRLYDDFEQGIVDVFGTTAPSEQVPASTEGAGAVVLTPAPAPTVPPPAGSVAPTPPATDPAPSTVSYTIDGRTLTEAELRTALQVADQTAHMQPILDTIASGDYMMVPKNFMPAAQPAPAPATPVVVDPIDTMIAEYEAVDPQAAQIMRVMQQRNNAENARLAAENVQLRGNDEQYAVAQQTAGLNLAVEQFKTHYALDDAAVNALSTRAGQTGYLQMMMQRRYDAAAQSGLPVDHAAIARDATIELLEYTRNATAVQPQPFQAQPAAPAASSQVAIPPTSPNAVPTSEADIEARVQARVQEELARKNTRNIHSALAGGSTGTPSLAPAPVDVSQMTPQQRKAYYEQGLLQGLTTMKANGQLEGLFGTS